MDQQSWVCFFTPNNVSDLEEMWLEILDVFVLSDSCTV